MKDKKKTIVFRYRPLGGGTTLLNEKGIPIPWELVEKGCLTAAFEYQISCGNGERMVLGIDDYLEIEDISGPVRLDALRLLVRLFSHEDRVLEIGSAGGYSGYVLSRLVKETIGLEWLEKWVLYAAKRYRSPSLSFFALDSWTEPLSLLPILDKGVDRVLLWSPLGRGVDEKKLTAFLERISSETGTLPLFWSERLSPGYDDTASAGLLAKMKGMLDRLKIDLWQCATAGRDLCIWPKSWEKETGTERVVKPPGEGFDWLLKRSGDTLILGPGLPETWLYEGLLRNQNRIYGRWTEGEETMPPSSGTIGLLPGSRGPVSGSGWDLVWGESKGDAPLAEVGPGALWRYACGESEQNRLRQQLSLDLKSGRSVEGLFCRQSLEMLVRLDLKEKLPLYPLFDASAADLQWYDAADYLDWTKKKAMLALTPEVWQQWEQALSDQSHRGLLILVGFSSCHLDLINAMALQGWRIALGANRPMDQVPLQSFEEFRLQLEQRGIQSEALWMGHLPPDPAYIKNIYSRFGRLLISTRSIFPSWDVKRVRFCLTFQPGDDIQQRLMNAYHQMAGIDDLDDFLMLYRWASSLEKAGQRQAAKLIFSRLMRARISESLDPVRRLAGVHFHLGRIAETESDFYTACRHYLQSVKLEPDFIQASERLFHLNHADVSKTV